MIWQIGIVIIYFLWILYWGFFHSWIGKTKNTKENKNEKLLKIESGGLFEDSRHIQIIGFSFLIAEMTLSISNQGLFLLLLIFGLLFLAAGICLLGMGRRKYRILATLLKNRTKNTQL